MKNRILSAIAASTMLFAAGCSLQEEPYGFYSSKNFYNTEADAESGLMYAYNALNYLEYLRGIWYIGDIPTETMYAKPDEPGDIHMLDRWTVDSNTELTHYYFKYCYIGINRANTVIARVGAMKNISDGGRKRIIGEAKFLRAWHYFNLVRSFGRVLFYTEPDQMTPPLAIGIEQIYGQIIDDLTDAETRLEVNKVFGRVDKVAAQALLSKVYLHIASSVDYEAPGYKGGTFLDMSEDELYSEAEDYSRKVIEDYNDKYFYDDNLLHIYDVYAPDGPEHIFIMAIDRSGTHEGQYSKIPLQFLPNNGGTPIYVKYSDGTLQRGNGNGWGVFIYEEEFVNTFLPTDKRRTELIHNQIYDANGVVVPSYSVLNRYYSAKYVDPDFNGEWTSARPYLIRFSDIALVFAEAVGPDEGLAVVNRIRTRAGVPNLPDGLLLEEFRKEVIKERALELAAEGNRLFDLRRTASVTTTSGTGATNLTEEAAAFYDMPQREVDLNPNVDSSNNN